MASPHQIQFAPIRPGEEKPVINMVLRSFDAAVAPEYSREGITEFRKYATLKEMAFRSRSHHFILVARQDRLPVGMIEISDKRHVSMFFVETGFRKQGIGRQLMERAIDICRKKQPRLTAVTVNASPNAIQAYRRLGFLETGPEKSINGIRYFPMMLELTRN